MYGILCFGDSITFGRGEKSNIGWCGRLKKYFESKDDYNGVYNLGIPGQNSQDLLQRIDIEIKARLRKKRPGDKYLILVGIGANDSKWEGLPEENKPRTDEKKFKENIKELIKKTKKYSAKLAFIGLIPVDESKTLPYENTSFTNKRIVLFNSLVKEVCQKNDILFLNIFDKMENKDHIKLLKDGLHPNSQGYEVMYLEIKEFLEKNRLI